MKGIVVSAVFVLALCSVARATESAGSNPSTDTEEKSKSLDSSHTHATSKSVAPLPKEPAAKDDDDVRSAKPLGHEHGAAMMDDGDDDGDGGE